MKKNRGFDPRFSKYVARLVDTLKTRNVKQLESVIFWGYDNFGAKAMSGICQKINKVDLPGIEVEDSNFFIEWHFNKLKNSNMWGEVQDRANAVLVKTLMDKGLELGKDFSFVNGGMALSEDAKKALMEEVPEVFHQEIEDQFAKNKLPTTK